MNVQRMVLMHNDAKGEGSRGGHVIGYTKSGKPFYNNPYHADHVGFSHDEHMQVARHHFQAAAHGPSSRAIGHEASAYVHQKLAKASR